MFEKENVYNEPVLLNFPNGITVSIKREDLLHPEVSGNKFRKLKYNIITARELGYQTLLTFGGAFSNHIAATAAAGRIAGMETVGVIRGEELEDKYQDNPTLFKAQKDGMRFKFVSRSAYREKTSEVFLKELENEFGRVFIVPEGGTNKEAIRGTEEILKPEDQAFDYIAVAVGTGGTIAGLINSAGKHQKILGFPALKGSFLSEEIDKFATNSNWDLIHDYHFGGYAKYNNELLSFIFSFKEKTGILLDPVYTGKMVFGICDLIEKGYFPNNSKILLIHTGGLQGWNESIKIK
ncbi:MAG: pyridoxal-phosphate dependent enzyme [Flavobacteriaceae bacterium]|jgi:1-aminocyclopropane-1-carboxylate deaminase|nr:pyridoxal-phosphate dependent enzyme [Flavobacteriaceae bacterium]